MQNLLCPVHVGRDAELRTVVAAADDVEAGHRGQALFIAGEAGLGKSRLVSEVLTAAAQRRFVRLVGHSTVDASVPFAPVVGALRRHLRRLPDQDLRRLFDGPALLASVLFPEAARIVGLPDGLQPAPEDLFAAVWQLLGRVCEDSCGLLVLEDVHWADPDTLRLLGYLSRELDDLPVLLVATYRPDELHRRHPLQVLLADLLRERVVRQVRLRTLDREQARAFVSAVFDGTEVSDEFVDALQSRADGNPFFLEELSRALVERGDVYRNGSDWSRRELGDIEIPETIKETLLARCRELDPAAMEILELAALAGDALEPAVLARAGGISPDALDEVLRVAIRLQLLVERPDALRQGTYQFRHALTREVFADELVGPDRRRAHLALAEAILAAEPDPASRAGELADHFAHAGDLQRAAPYALAAARRAAAAHAQEEARRRYEQVLVATPSTHAQRLGLLLEAARETLDPLDRRAALAFAREARSIAQEQGDPLAEARALRVVARDRWHGGDTEGQLDLAREVLRLVEGRDDDEEATALHQLSRLLRLSDLVDEASALAARGIEVATRVGNDRALSGLYGTQAMSLDFGSAEWQEAVDASILHARRAGGDDGLANILTNSGYMQIWGGQLKAAVRALEEAVDLSARFKPTDRYSLAGLAWALSLAGDYARAESLARDIVSAPDTPPRIVALTALAEVAQRRGDPGAAAVVSELLEVATATGTQQRIVPALAAAARQAVADGAFEDGAHHFEQAMARTRAPNAKGSHWMFSPDYAAALAELGHLDRLERWLGDVRALTEADPIPHNRAAAALCEAHLAAASGAPAEATARFEVAAAAYAEMPCPARVAEALIGTAAIAWAGGRLEASVAAAERARELAESTGALVLAGLAASAADRAHAVPVLATVLFTDIVGSTERAAAIGDPAWRALLERHHAAVRAALHACGGREIDTAGDGFLAAFDGPAQAIRCAGAIRGAVERLGLSVRAGIHTGECHSSGGKLTGLAVHIAARVCARALPGEVLVSSTVRELLAGSVIEFADRGVHELKGVPGEWRLFSVPNLLASV